MKWTVWVVKYIYFQLTCVTERLILTWNNRKGNAMKWANEKRKENRRAHTHIFGWLRMCLRCYILAFVRNIDSSKALRKTNNGFLYDDVKRKIISLKMFSQSSDSCWCLLSHSRNQEMSLLIWCLSFLFVCPFFFCSVTRCTRFKINAKQMSEREEEWQAEKSHQSQRQRQRQRLRERRRNEEKNERATKQIICTYVFVDLFARQKKKRPAKKNDEDDDGDDAEDAQKRGKIARCAIWVLVSTMAHMHGRAPRLCLSTMFIKLLHVCQNEYRYSVAWKWNVFVFTRFIPICYIALNILFLNQSLLQSPSHLCRITSRTC